MFFNLKGEIMSDIEEKSKKDKNKEYTISDFEKDYNKYLKRDALKSPVLDEFGVETLPRLSSGSLALDIDLGGGYPCWRTTIMKGMESVGKTFLLNKVMANVTQAGDLVYFAEPEKTWEEYWAVKCGVNLKNIRMSDCAYAEEELDMLEMAVRSGVFKLVILDSIGSLINKTDLDNENEKDSMGKLAKLLQKAFRKLNTAYREVRQKGKEVYCVFTNQLTNKIGITFGSPITEPGGNAVKFHPAIRIDLSKDELVKEGASEESNFIGQTICYTTAKNKTYPPFKTGKIRYYFDSNNVGEIDNIYSLVQFGLKYGFIEVKGSWYSGHWIGRDGQKIQGGDSVVDFLRTESIENLNKRLEDLSKVALPDRNLDFRF